MDETQTSIVKRAYEGGEIIGGENECSGLPQGYVTYQYPARPKPGTESVSYEGIFRNGQEHGPGKITWSDGSSYEGDFDHGKTVGQGVLKNADGVITYVGQYDMRLSNHGWGIQFLPNGAYYEGQFSRGKRSGHGLMKYPNNDWYFGFWRNGVREGSGTYEFTATGDTISGEWKEGENETYTLIKKAKDHKDDLNCLHDTIDAMALSLDRWQQACDSLQVEAKEAGVDPAVMKKIIDKAVFRK